VWEPTLEQPAPLPAAAAAIMARNRAANARPPPARRPPAEDGEGGDELLQVRGGAYQPAPCRPALHWLRWCVLVI
jgi:hypothetical protein